MGLTSISLHTQHISLFLIFKAAFHLKGLVFSVELTRLLGKGSCCGSLGLPSWVGEDLGCHPAAETWACCPGPTAASGMAPEGCDFGLGRRAQNACFAYLTSISLIHV
ncbi:uncharacterized protein LOC121786730 [Salvia splendens]|uniref:uncharacterized protein LOC121786730 n=1 Tax=Salvia splendens TaxID=180675 RepID=UPI001C27B08F|nr:uncharacterized protein LOC121786730 [Salvia splendens]